MKAKRLLLVGLGKAPKAKLHDVRKAAGTAVRFAKPRGIRSLAIAVPIHFDPAAATRAIVEGAYIGDFDPDTYRSDRKDKSIERLTVIVSERESRAAAETGFSEGNILGQAQNFARSLVNEPGNRLTPTVLGERAAEMCKAIWPQMRGVRRRQAQRIENGRLLERFPGFGGGRLR